MLPQALLNDALVLECASSFFWWIREGEAQRQPIPSIPEASISACGGWSQWRGPPPREKFRSGTLSQGFKVWALGFRLAGVGVVFLALDFCLRREKRQCSTQV